MTIRIDRRKFLMGSSALLAAGAAGVSPSFAQSDALRLLFWGGQDRADRTYAVSDMFTEASGVSMEPEFLSWSDYWPKLATQTAGGNAPDIVQMDYRYIVEYASRNAIAPLDEFVGGPLKLDSFDQDQLDGGKVGGQLFGISLGANSVATLVNTDAFAEVGIDAPTNAWTYDDIMEMAEAFNSANIRGGMKVMSDGSYTEPMLHNWLRQRGKELYTPEGKLAFDEDDAIEWYTMWDKLRKAGACVSAEDQALDSGPLETTMIVLGKSALMPSNSNQLVAYQTIVQDDLNMIGYPRAAAGSGGGHYRKPSMFFSVGGSSANKEKAAEFLNFFISNPEAAKVLGVERGIPCLPSTREVVAPTLDEKGQIALNFVANLGDLLGALPPPPPPSAGEIDASLIRTLGQEVGFGAKSPEQAGRDLVSGANDILSRS
ncbi:extracellular solute-binding protein [Devosia sp. J2-20]|uniref:Extracellular solute-binding protein n=1 Tax=Devosia litorisediminis TaxID=2829817 RepID=A0A942E9A8_9HYPH|nr:MULTISPECIES: extracellular solute-binding protein [Devosia]MBS3850473.1 extracellular solute-binding protein [Devosia litorisediminis]MCZ4347852.1 extracellular solute-binding protein [Devosia neptuniae]WDR00223.1 extracellular solute-binding protein [Devosia sp. J2-20]